ncbi:MAG TPA: class I SAM-dependent methyltransferase, partial [Verrucomicrobiae bacterium]|nr:class I SAM-dependent methyltransferase [Verrucomicrobiae bacterium]
LVEASMDELSMLPEAGFDAVFQPVSSCYVPDVALLYRQVARVLVTGGLYLSQHKQPAALQAAKEWQAEPGGYLMQEPYYRAGPLSAAPPGSLHREPGTIEFLHRWEELLGGLCRSGFVIEDVAEPRRGDPKAGPGEFEHRNCYLPPFVAFKARRTSQVVEGKTLKIWVPQ